MDRPKDIPAGARAVRQPQGYTFWIIGDERTRLRDAYHTFLRLRWSAAIGLIALGFFAVNLVFAIAYYFVGGVEGVAPQSFFDALVFSVETLGTIGYGVMYPKSHAADVIMIVEAVTSVVTIALATGLVFTKFARATARVAFSPTAVVTQHDGKRTLMFRVGNQRSNTIVEAQVPVTVAMTQTTMEGNTFYKMHDLALVRPRMSGLRRGWTIMHVIDETSPLHGLATPDLKAREVEIEVSLVGLDDVMMQTIHSNHTYRDDEILIGHRFVDTLRPLANGDMLLDLRNFNLTTPE